jgi:hypothetical protein
VLACVVSFTYAASQTKRVGVAVAGWLRLAIFNLVSAASLCQICGYVGVYVIRAGGTLNLFCMPP